SRCGPRVLPPAHHRGRQLGRALRGAPSTQSGQPSTRPCPTDPPPGRIDAPDAPPERASQPNPVGPCEVPGASPRKHRGHPTESGDRRELTLNEVNGEAEVEPRRMAYEAASGALAASRRRMWCVSLTSYVWPRHRIVVGRRVRRRPAVITHGTAIAAMAVRHAGTFQAAATVGAAEKRARRRKEAFAI